MQDWRRAAFSIQDRHCQSVCKHFRAAVRSNGAAEARQTVSGDWRLAGSSFPSRMAAFMPPCWLSGGSPGLIIALLLPPKATIADTACGRPRCTLPAASPPRASPSHRSSCVTLLYSQACGSSAEARCSAARNHAARGARGTRRGPGGVRGGSTIVDPQNTMQGGTRRGRAMWGTNGAAQRRAGMICTKAAVASSPLPRSRQIARAC